MSSEQSRERVRRSLPRSGAHFEQAAERVAQRMAREPAPVLRERPEAESAALPPATRSFFQAKLGHDFSRVRVYTGNEAATAAATEGALAYTVGHDIVFGRGSYAPETPQGRALLAHELIHTEQQRGRAPILQKQVSVGPQPPPVGSLQPISPLAGLRPLTNAQLQQLTTQREAPIRRWLQANLANLILLSARAIIARVRRNVREAADFGDSELQSTIVAWAAENNVTPPPISAVPDPTDAALPLAPTPIASPLTDNAIFSSVSRAVHAAIDGVGVRRAHGRAIVSVSGATLGFRSTDGTEVAATRSWGGRLGVQAERGEFHFEATIGTDKWEMTFSFGSDTAVPDISRLERVFSEGESALRRIASEIGTFGNLSDVSRIKDAIHPYTEPLSDAIEALKGIAQTPRVSVGVSASGPGTAPPAPGTEPRATAITATLTIHF